MQCGQLRNGKRAACNHGVMDARGRLLSTKEAQESHEAIAECDSSFLSARSIHNSMVAQLQRLPFLL